MSDNTPAAESSKWQPPAPASSKAVSDNPKDLCAQQKVDMSVVPVVGMWHTAHAMMDGARNYGRYNWRAKHVIASIYYSAARRHLDWWWEGQDIDTKSLVHHLGHLAANAMILLDAIEGGTLIDDRPFVSDEVRTRLLSRMESLVKASK